MTPAGRAAIFAALLAAASPAVGGSDLQILSFDDLSGWAEDDHEAALKTFLKTCDIPSEPEWRGLCKLAKAQGGGRSFFELFFRPVLIGGDEEALFTGYYEPELRGSLTPSARYRFPLFAKPRELPDGQPWATRAQIEEEGLLAGRGLEIAWVEDPVELFFLQIQGSGRIRLPGGQVIRVGYGGHNGHNYRSIGQEMIRRGIYEAHQVSAQVIKNWVRRNPVDGQELLRHNPSFVFFRKVTGNDPGEGPIGAMNRPVTAGRSIAVDPDFTPLGAPVWIEKNGAERIRRLMIAQDTGSAIKGSQRADIFFGSGDKAGKAAGKVRDPGRMVVLVPIQRAYAMTEEE
ncbi:murein transglycosylase A [Aliiruegeria lutimaris]|uniref:peptidoglycan lytic exotransglycosylase n=1 Tax=Aliiruegeria lutimaris TaxID=571298 RepID=A0A1G8NBP7_9RHOB|nr:MltA domain-containing protein [Aliiruegeria lutimaris]SDI77588.1 membrane-bound lytic murein transglycosylase A [Aliiruegeria lutimaris]